MRIGDRAWKLMQGRAESRDRPLNLSSNVRNRVTHSGKRANELPVAVGWEEARMKTELISIAHIQARIHVVRGKRVMLDADLARFYGVGTRDLNKAVTRNHDRFPEDFAFSLTMEETRNLMFQAGTSSAQPAEKEMEVAGRAHGGRRKPAVAFTEQGVAMLASVLRSPRAVAVSVALVRAFVQLRELLATHRQLAAKLGELERKVAGHDHAIRNLFEAIRQLLSEPEKPPREMGFHTLIGRRKVRR
jgi:hypothetical protein